MIYNETMSRAYLPTRVGLDKYTVRRTGTREGVLVETQRTGVRRMGVPN